MTAGSREGVFISRFVDGMESRIAAGKVPQFIKLNPQIIGQVAHELIEGCAVYLMACRERGSEVQYIKIGLARNIKKRVEAISVGCPLEIKKVLYFCMGSYGRALKLERSLHKEFAVNRVTGEWFRFDNQQEKAEQVEKILVFVEHNMGPDFNMFLYDTALTKDPDIKELTEFARLVWSLTDDRLDTKWLEDALTSNGMGAGWKTPRI